MTERCSWCESEPLYIDYHDTEWGVPERCPRALFEALTLEGFQAGLSWITILRKREGFRRAFAGFEPDVIAKWGEAEVTQLLNDDGIIRHRGKIEATINNANRALEMLGEFDSLADFFWQFEPKKQLSIRNRSQIPAKTDESIALSKDLKKRGWKFVGPTTCYAFMQSMGIVNDHVQSCEFHAISKAARGKLKR
jgi:DNA-3-methyladenine glycosylase I